SGVKETMKFLISAACAFALGFIAVLIYQTEFVFILFALLGGFAANTAVEALYSRGLRRFGRGCITYGAFAVSFLVFYTVCVFGAFGYGTTAPAAKDISYITVDFPYYYYSAAENKDGGEVVFMDYFRSEYSDVYLRTQDGRYISNLTDAYETQEDIETVLYLQKVLARDVLQPPFGVSDQQDTFTMTIEYHLFNGGTVTRQYRIPRDLASGFDDENLMSYTIAEQRVIETVQELRNRGVRGQLLDQLLEKGTLAEWNMNYDAYEYAEELEALEKLWGAAYEEELKALQEKYGERLYATTNYECYSERDGAKTAALMEILRTAPVSGMEGNYVTGHMYLEFTLPAEEVDSRYVKMLTKGHENAVLRLSFSTNFSYADEELVEFIMEYGQKY
ncbi:MAG: hypothetical protein IKU17_02305, partial [Clostridia bacterium]|nr:hypothetical protein [Clostridia bacterium]